MKVLAQKSSPLSVDVRGSTDVDLCLTLQYRQSRTDRHQAYNIVAQRDSQMTVRSSQAARGDSAAMKTMAVLTLIFLLQRLLMVWPTTCWMGTRH